MVVEKGKYLPTLWWLKRGRTWGGIFSSPNCHGNSAPAFGTAVNGINRVDQIRRGGFRPQFFPSESATE